MLSHRGVDPRRLLGFFKSLLLSCHLAVKADHMALHHAPMTKHYFAALAAGHRYGLCFSVEYQSGFRFRVDSLHTVIFQCQTVKGLTKPIHIDATVPGEARWAGSVLVFHRALPDLQRMKHKPDQAFGHREVFCFFLVLHRALPDLQRMKLCYSAAASSAPRSVFAWCD